MSDDEKQRLRKCLRAGVEDLPVLPAVLTKLMGLSRTADDYLERVLELVEAEPSYAARVLAVANSALSGAARPITGLPRGDCPIGERPHGRRRNGAVRSSRLRSA
jgi:HD-like signal output (HDOD) protein